MNAAVRRSWGLGVERDPFEAYRKWKRWDEGSFGQPNRLEERYFDLELRQSGIDLDKKLRALEIGFGNGAFAGWCRRRGWNYSGIELDPSLVERAREAGFDAHVAAAPLPAAVLERSFDVIVAFDVIEHMEVPDLRALLTACGTVLAPGGVLIARFPNGDSPFSGTHQNGDVTHRLHLGASAIHQLASWTGLRVVQTRDQAMPIRGIGRKAGRRQFGRLVVGRMTGWFVGRYFHSGRPTPVGANLVAVLARADAPAG